MPLKEEGLKQGRPTGTDLFYLHELEGTKGCKGVLDNGLGVQEAGDKVLWLCWGLREERALATEPGSLWQRWEGTPHHLEVASTTLNPFWLENRLFLSLPAGPAVEKSFGAM